MIGVLDIFAFIVMAVLFLTMVAIIVALGSLPGLIARKRNHPQSAAVNIASWLGLATGGILWPLALIWAYWVPSTPTQPASDQTAEKANMQARIQTLEARLSELNAGEEGAIVIAFLLIVYTAIVVALFKLKLMKPKPVPIAGCVVAGILILGTVVVAWFQSAPMSSRVVTFQPVVTLVPYVKGQVLKIHAVGSQPVKKGDLLLEINPEPYQFAVNQVTAQLNAAKQNVKQSEAGVQAAQANVRKSVASVKQARAAVSDAEATVANAKAVVAKAKATYDLARTEETIALKLQKSDAGAISELKVAEAIQKREAHDAALKQAEAGVGQAQAGKVQADAGLDVAISAQAQAEAAERQAGFALQMAQSNVVAVSAEFDTAAFNLRECKIYAPGDGYVVNWGVQEGVMLLAGPMAPAGTFVITQDTQIVAAFPQNHLANVKPGDDVELVLDPFPGRLFKAKVDVVIPATGEGQYSPSGQIPYAAKVGSEGMLVVKIRVIDEDPTLQLPLGAGGAVAIYTDSGKSVHVISKVAIRMKRWLLYVIPS